MKKITVHCGETIQNLCGESLHPVTEVKRAIELVKSSTDEFVYSNSPDFVAAIKYASEKNDSIELEFFLNGVSCGTDIEPIFEDFNRALDMINDINNLI